MGLQYCEGAGHFGYHCLNAVAASGRSVPSAWCERQGKQAFPVASMWPRCQDIGKLHRAAHAVQSSAQCSWRLVRCAREERSRPLPTRANENGRCRMKMGPALLPTPLSPMRGLASEEAGTWHPMFSRTNRPKTFRAVLSPALAPASGSTLRSARSGCAAVRRPPLDVPSRASTGGSAVWLSDTGRRLERLHCPSGPRTFSAMPPRHPAGLARPMEKSLWFLSSIRLALDRSPPHEDLEKHMDSFSHVFPE